MLRLLANIETSLIVLEGFSTRYRVIKQEWDEGVRCDGVSAYRQEEEEEEGGSCLVKPGNESKLWNTCRLPPPGFVAAVVCGTALFCVTHTPQIEI